MKVKIIILPTDRKACERTVPAGKGLTSPPSADYNDVKNINFSSASSFYFNTALSLNPTNATFIFITDFFNTHKSPRDLSGVNSYPACSADIRAYLPFWHSECSNTLPP